MPLMKKYPKHVAFDLGDIAEWAEVSNHSLPKALSLATKKVVEVVEWGVKKKIIILTFHLLPSKFTASFFPESMSAISSLLEDLAKHPLIHEKKVKISIIGKWYDLPSSIVDAVKKVLDETKDYDRYFLNLCLNYDGKEEIVDAFKLLGMQIKTGRMDPELIDRDSIKENLYSSYFLPPDLMIKNGNRKETSGFLLWDSVNTKIYFTNKLWPDFDKTEFMDAIKDFQKGD